MAKVNVKFNEEAFAKEVIDAFKKVKLGKQYNDAVGEFLVGRIAGEARRGRPLNASRSFPKLKDLSVIRREALAEVNETHPAFRPPKSNITLTGQLIDALTYKFNRTAGVVEIFVAKTRRRKLNIPEGFPKTPQVAYNQTLDRQLRKRGFRMFTPKGIKSEDRIPKRIKSITLKFLRRALRVAKLRS